MICLPYLCALVLNVESVRTNPINLKPSCEAWEMERCETKDETYHTAPTPEQERETHRRYLNFVIERGWEGDFEEFKNEAR